MQRWDRIKSGFGSDGIWRARDPYWFEYGMEPEALRQTWIMEADQLLNREDFWIAAPLLLKAGALTAERYAIIEPWVVEARLFHQAAEEVQILTAVCCQYLPDCEDKLLEVCRRDDEGREYEANHILDYMMMAGSKKAAGYVLNWLQANFEKLLQSGNDFEFWLLVRIRSLNRAGVAVPDRLLSQVREAVYSHFPYLAPDAEVPDNHLSRATSLNVFFELGMEDELKSHAFDLLNPQCISKWTTDQSVRDFVFYGLSDLLLVCSLARNPILPQFLPEIFGLIGTLSESSPIASEHLACLRSALEIASWRCDFHPMNNAQAQPRTSLQI